MIDTDPFHGPPPAEIPLKKAPLVRVLAQISFHEILSISDREFIAKFQERIRSEFPAIKREESKTIEIQNNRHSVTVEPVWRFYDPTSPWRVTLSQGFLALETMEYTSRKDFFKRLSEIANAANETIRLGHLTRIGVRYIDQIQKPEFDQLADLVQPEFLGVHKKIGLQATNHSINEIAAAVTEGQLTSRWGVLPPRGTIDHSVLYPVNEWSWFLDVDVFTTPDLMGGVILPEKAATHAEQLATRAYTFFRWAITDQFLETYGD